MGESPRSSTLPELCCPECDYDLTGAPGKRCPWCGWEIDVDTLVRVARDRTSAARYAFAVTAGALGVGSFVAIASLISPPKRLSLADAATVLGVLCAGAGHTWLAVLAALSRRRWPLRHQEAGSILRLVGWFAVVTGFLGASQALEVASNARGVEGIVVRGVFEFVLSATLFTMPGWTLLGLRFVGFRATQDLTLSSRPTKPLDSEVYAPFAIELFGPYRCDQIRQTHSTERRPTTPAIEAAISRTWKAESQAAQGTHRMLHNGDLIRLIRVTRNSDSPELRFSSTSYREFLGTNLFNAKLVRDENPSGFSDPLGISAVIITADGFLAMGRRSDRVAFHRGFLHLFGGMLEPLDRDVASTGGDLDLSGSIVRELHEELNLEISELGEVTVLGIVRDPAIHQPELIFDVPVQLKRAELAGRFDAIADPEHTGVEFVYEDPDSVAPFLRSSTNMTPVAQAGILLHGRHAWGATWYEQACYVLYGTVPNQDVSAEG